MASFITFKINFLPANDTVISVSDSATMIDIELTFKTTLNGAKQCPIRSTVDEQVFSLHVALHKNYNIFSTYEIVSNVISDEVFVTALLPFPSRQFAEITNTTAGAIDITINNDSVVGTFTIDTTVSSEATVGIPCDDVKLSVTTTPQADNITSPVSEAVSTNPHVFETPRADLITIVMDESGIERTRRVRIPQLLTAFIDIDIIESPSGGIVTVNRLYPLSSLGAFTLLLTFEYRMDMGGDYQLSNSWSGISEGAHTVYIKDNIGCEINIPITVGAFSANLVDFDPFVKISNANSLRFKLDEIWDTECGIRRNNANTLSFEEDVKLNSRNYLQPFQKCDSPITQIQSNYDTHVAKLYDCDGEVETLNVVKMTENMNIQDVRDGKIKILSGGVIGVYFGSGNRWDPITPTTNIGTYNLLESLMDWINVGDYLSVEGLGWARITQILPPTTALNFYVAVLGLTNDLNYGDGSTHKISTVYNAVDYDRFEFLLDLSTRSGTYYVKVDATDATFTAKSFTSEWINVQTVHKNHHIIEWYSTRNNEINYGTGITNTARFPYIRNLKWKPNTEQEIHVTDTSTINLDSKGREFYEMALMPLPTAMAQKVVLILLHNRIFIEGESYLLEGEPESIQYGSTNLYTIKANLVRSDFVFSPTQGTVSGEILLGAGVPLLIDENARGLLFIR